MVEGLVALHVDNYKASGAELIMGEGRFVAPKTIEVRLNDGGTRVLSGERVFLNVGTHATIPPIPGLAEAKPMTHIEMSETGRLPEHLVVLGGGYVGLEFAQAYRRLGSRVTVLERGPQLIGREDQDAAEEVRQFLAAEGIEILLQTEIVKVQGKSGEASLPSPSGRGARVEGVVLTVRARPAIVKSSAATSLPPPAARPTRRASVSIRPASRWTHGNTSKSMTGWKPPLPTFGRSANAPAVRSSRTSRKTTSASSATIWPAAIAARKAASCPSASSPTRRWPAWG